jgi:putative nucleotidyltransferase with HDIG domain
VPLSVIDQVARNATSIVNQKITADAIRRDEMKHKIRNLFHGFLDSSEFDHERSQHALKECQKIIGTYILETEPSVDLLEQTRSILSNFHGNYDHSLNVSIFSTIFALALGIPDAAAASIGGLLHDVGLSLLPKDFHSNRFEKMTSAQQVIYKTHAMAGAGFLRKKNLKASESVFAIIQQHHENYDGTGYPLGIDGKKIHILARICQIADEFDYLLNRNSEKKLSPKEAFDIMTQLNEGPEKKFDQDLIDKLKTSLDSFLAKNFTETVTPMISAEPPMSSESLEDRAKRKVEGQHPWRFVK